MTEDLGRKRLPLFHRAVLPTYLEGPPARFNGRAKHVSCIKRSLIRTLQSTRIQGTVWLTKLRRVCAFQSVVTHGENALPASDAAYAKAKELHQGMD
jgi:hypothetical protein